MVDKDALLEKLTNEDVVKIIESLGGYLHKENGRGSDIESLIFPTVCHHGDSTKLYYYPDNKIFHCYTACGESFNVYGLVMRSKEVNFYEALIYVANTLGYHSLKSKIGFGDPEKIDDWVILDKYRKFMNKKEIPVLAVYEDRLLNMFSDFYYDGWIEEGITIETMKKYNIKYSIEKQKIIIPHYNIDGGLVGIRGRSLNQLDVDSGFKYMPIEIEGKMYSHQTMFNLYGLDKNKDVIKSAKKVMIVEAEKSVMQCDSFYNGNNFAVAVSGSVVSNYQRDLILSCSPSEVIIAFDKEYSDDDSIEKYFNKILKIAYKFINFCTVYVLYDKGNLTGFKSSPTDYGKETLEKLMKTKYEIKGDIDEI